MARTPELRRRGVWRRLDALSRFMFPLGFLMFGLFVAGMPFGLPWQAALRPVYAMACVFFWSLYRPSSLPAPFVALVGVLVDLAGGSPMGMWAVLLLVLQGVILAVQRRLVGQRFLLVWLVFCGMSSCGAGLAWAVESLFSLRILPLMPLGAEILLAMGLYPALAAFFIRAHRGPAAVELA
ncbi:MAG: rod shape-determining protein MreD [Acidocella sp.]|nr:rod shape-determining protein MreD [Acidocella sp.]